MPLTKQQSDELIEDRAALRGLQKALNNAESILRDAVAEWRTKSPGGSVAMAAYASWCERRHEIDQLHKLSLEDAIAQTQEHAAQAARIKTAIDLCLLGNKPSVPIRDPFGAHVWPDTTLQFRPVPVAELERLQGIALAAHKKSQDRTLAYATLTATVDQDLEAHEDRKPSVDPIDDGSSQWLVYTGAKAVVDAARAARDQLSEAIEAKKLEFTGGEKPKKKKRKA